MLSLANLYQAGAHRGNSKSKINPKLKSSIHTTTGNTCTIDLVSTINSINNAKELFHRIGAKKRQIIIVGTSNHISNKVVEYSKQFTGGDQPFVNVRWLGGTLTNWFTIKKNLRILEKFESIISDAKFFVTLARNEQLSTNRKVDKMKKVFSGLTLLKTNKPGAIFILDGSQNSIALKEAELVGCPVVILTNTFIKTLPKKLDTTIVCNNNSLNAVDMIVSELITAFNEGYASGAITNNKPTETKTNISPVEKKDLESVKIN
jgi:small subunit ribosomal protein S2